MIFMALPSKAICGKVNTGFPTLSPDRLPTLRMQAQEQRSRPRILFGIGEEGGKPIYLQALGLRSGRLSR